MFSISSSAMGATSTFESEDPEPTPTTSEPVQPQPPAVARPAAVPAVSPQPALDALRKAVLLKTKKKIVRYRKSAWRWQELMGVSRTHASPSSARTKSVPYARWVLNLWKARSKRLHSEARSWMADKIVSYKQTTRHWSLVTGRKFPGGASQSRTTMSASRNIEAEYNRWRKITKAVLVVAYNPPHRQQWLCIHRYERHPAQGWATRTGNGYYGGLQMDLSFQSSYGEYLLKNKGTANNWTAEEQMWVAERAYSSGRGFYPWPNTARYCGLI